MRYTDTRTHTHSTNILGGTSMVVISFLARVNSTGIEPFQTASRTSLSIHRAAAEEEDEEDAKGEIEVEEEEVDANVAIGRDVCDVNDRTIMSRPARPPAPPARARPGPAPRGERNRPRPHICMIPILAFPGLPRYTDGHRARMHARTHTYRHRRHARPRTTRVRRARGGPDRTAGPDFGEVCTYRPTSRPSSRRVPSVVNMLSYTVGRLRAAHANIRT